MTSVCVRPAPHAATRSAPHGARILCAVLPYLMPEGVLTNESDRAKRGVMTTEEMTTTAATEIASAAPRRRAGRPRKTQGASEPPAPKRGRRPRLSGDALVTSLAEMVDLLIKENRQLKRALARAEKARVSVNSGQATKALSGLQRRLTRALDSSPTTRRPRSTTAAAASIRTRRKVTDPDVLERRRQALAKARAVRQSRRRTASE